MKKSFLLTIILSFTMCLLFLIGSSGNALAEDSDKLKTYPFIPSSYFEYYSLTSPIDVCEDENYIYIAETNALIKYDKSLQEYERFSLSEMTITKIGCYKNKVYFLSSSALYSVSPTNFTAYEKVKLDQEGISSSFYISDLLYANTSSEVVISSLNENTGLYEKKETQSLGKTITLAVNQATGERFSALYYFNESSCYALYGNGNTEKLFDASVSFAQYYNGKIYYVTSGGLFAYSTENKNTISLTETDENKEYAGGFYIYQDRVLICYKDLNIIKEFDLKTYKFTDRIITTYSDEQNRLPKNVKDIVINENYLYVLTQNSKSVMQLTKFSLTENKYYTLNADLSFYPKIFAVSGDDILLANGTDAIKIFEQGEEKNGVISCTEKYSLTGTNANNIVSVNNFEGNFYIIKNTTVTSSKQYPTVIQTQKTTGGYNINVNSYKYFEQKEGTAKTCTINAFGEIFILLSDGNVIKYDLINNLWEQSDITVPTEATKIQADFENLYYDLNGKIVNAKTNTAYEIEKNINFGNGELISFEFSSDLSKVFFLYEGYLVYTTSLPLKTPNNFEIPVGYGTTLMSEIETTTVNSGAKMYEVQKGENNYFNYISYKISASSEQYIVIDKNENGFLIIANGETTYIVRNADTKTTKNNKEQAEYQTGYYLIKAGIYSVPQLNKDFKIGEVDKYEKVIVESQFSVGGQKYLLVQRENGQKGFIEKTFVSKQILELSEMTSFKIYKCKSTPVYDKAGNVIGNISGNVAVYSFKDGKYKIKYSSGENGIGYIPYEAIVVNKDKTIRNTLLLIIVLSAFLITTIYLRNRAKRKNLAN